MEIGFKRHFKAKDPLLTKEADKRLTRMGINWLVSALLIAYGIQESGLIFENCDFCVWMAELVPAINVMSVGSYDANAMRFVMLFHTIVGPIFFLLVLIYVNEFRRYNLVWWGYPFFILVMVFGGYVSFWGLGFGGEESKGFFMRCYYESLACSTAGALAPWIALIGALHTLYFTTVVRLIIALEFPDRTQAKKRNVK